MTKGISQMGATADRGDARPADHARQSSRTKRSSAAIDVEGDALTAESLTTDALAADALAATALLPTRSEPPMGEPSDSAGKGAASSAAEFIRLSSFVVFNITSFLLIIHYLPKEEMGWYALVNVVVNLAYVVAELQMEKIAVRRITQGMPVEEVIGAAVGVRLAGSVMATVVTQLLFLLMGLARGNVNGQVQLAALLASSQFFGESAFVVGATFQAQLRAYLDVIPRIIYVVLRFALTIALLALGVPWWALFLAWVAAYAIADVVAFAVFRFKTHLRIRPTVRGNGHLVREALTLGVAGLLGMATVQWGTIYLGMTSEPATVAVFNTAVLPIQYLSMFGGVIAIVAFPLVSAAWARGDRAAFGRLDGTARTAILALFLPLTIVLFKVPLGEVMGNVFGKGYEGAAQPLRLMSIALILASMVVWAGFVFLSVGHLRAILIINGTCLAIGIAASPVLVPGMGIDGLGVVGIIATAVGLAVAGVFLRRDTPARFDLRGTVRVLLCGTVLWLALEAIERVTDSVVAIVAMTVVLYPVLVLITKVLPANVIDDVRAGTSSADHPDDAAMASSAPAASATAPPSSGGIS